MRSLIFGSSALKHWFPDYTSEPKDIDVLGYSVPEGFTATLPIETLWAEPFRHVIENNSDPLYVDPDFLYTIKVSHMPWEGRNKKWGKHLKDVAFLKAKGCNLDKELHQTLLKLWSERFGSKEHIKFTKALPEFFNEAVAREFDHDWLHQQFAAGGTPAYKLILQNDETPLCSAGKFAKLPPNKQLHCALEEMFVISFERKVSLYSAYKALVTTMTKGWFNTYIIEHCSELLSGCQSEKEVYFNRTKEILNEFRNS